VWCKGVGLDFIPLLDAGEIEKLGDQMKSHLGLYGNVGIVRVYCHACRMWAFVLDGIKQCCDKPVDSRPERSKRIMEPPFERKVPSPKEKQEILQGQDYRCIYCDKTFGDVVQRRKKDLVLRIEWDHRICFAYGQNNHVSNFVAACQVCNRIKSSLVFSDLDEARLHLSIKRREKGYDF